MKGVTLWSCAWLLLVLTGVAVTARFQASAGVSRAVSDEVRLVASVQPVQMADGTLGLADASGVVVPLREYARIAAASTLADALLLALAEPERIAALSEYGRKHSGVPHLYGARPLLHSS